MVRKLAKGFLNYVKANKTRVETMVKNHDVYAIRNGAAEQGVELTPQEVKDYVEMLKLGLLIVSQYDEEEPDGYDWDV